MLLALCLFNGSWSASARAQEGPAAVAIDRCSDRAVAAIQKRYEGVRDISARFEQTTRAVSMGSAPNEPVVSRGKVILAKPGRMRWSYEEPEPSLVISDGTTIWLYDPAFGEAQKMPATGGFLHGATAQFLLGEGDIRRDFEVSGVACSETQAELELVPREPAGFEKVFLQVDPATGDVLGSRIVDLLGNVVSIRFEGLQTNLDPPADQFRFDPPEGVKVIEVAP
jgi:outer membrane lipoprotein carrier protein